MEQIFAGAFPENYEPPSGFYFEVNDNSPVVQVIFCTLVVKYFSYLFFCSFMDGLILEFWFLGF